MKKKYHYKTTLLFILIGMLVQTVQAFDLNDIDGSNGFVVAGLNEFDQLGFAVNQIGDINNDGIDDIAIGDYGADSNDENASGASYIIFGGTDINSRLFDLNLLDGNNGFVVKGFRANQISGVAVSPAGDFNGDGIDDFMIGAPQTSNLGGAYLIFGKQGAFPAVIELSEIDGTSGFYIQCSSSNSHLGFSLSSAGDFNNDGIDDIIIGAFRGWFEEEESGGAWVVYGKTTPMPAVYDITNISMQDGFLVSGEALNDRAGRSVGHLGDFNGDGIDDVIIGAYTADPNGNSSGKAYVLYGTNGSNTSYLRLAEINGNNGFVIHGNNPESRLGISARLAGDINNDGFNDIILGGFSTNDNLLNEEVYVIFGTGVGLSSPFQLSTLNGINGFTMTGSATNESLGYSTSGAGDINGDGIDDVIIGAHNAANNGNESGSAYVVYGSESPFAATININALNATQGFRIDGFDEGDSFGISVNSVGDFNSDGIGDFVVGAEGADVDSSSEPKGAAYVIYGKSDVIFSSGFE